jgi:hypothetical protein
MTAHEQAHAERTLQRVDRLLCQRLFGQLSDEQTLELIADAVGQWTDPLPEPAEAPLTGWKHNYSTSQDA